ncbi:hypothetical protein ZHAS_00020714 [Anopheles sinensis]|uniref:Uncharacterized protein n=1 Tax=Anopheles sinensis TaxID=74873 RepID=A0A084WQH8_ANOSI|nr:hypothetical protein ZHAS_00020714 [Anopheles sinensis]
MSKSATTKHDPKPDGSASAHHGPSIEASAVGAKRTVQEKRCNVMAGKSTPVASGAAGKNVGQAPSARRKHVQS